MGFRFYYFTFLHFRFCELVKSCFNGNKPYFFKEKYSLPKKNGMSTYLFILLFNGPFVPLFF